MAKTFLQEAFKQLEILDEEDFRLDDKGADELKDFVMNDTTDEFVDIIDPEAETEEDLEDSYIGKVILECSVCKSKLYKDKEDVIIEDDADVANVGEECPFCYSADGFKVIGQVCEFQAEDEVTVDVEPKEPEEPEVEEDEEEDEEKNEAFGFGKKKQCKDGNCVAPKLTDDEKAYYDGINNPKFVGGEPFADEKKKAHDYFEKSIKHESLDRKAVLESVAKKRAEARKNESLDTSEVNTLVDALNDISEGNGDKAEGKISKLVKKNLKGDNKLNYDKKTFKYSLDSTKKNEAFEKVELETDNEKITVKTEPKEEIPDAEMIAPIEDEVKSQIEDNTVEDEEEPNDIGEIDYDVDEFGEDEFSGLGESYLKKTYDNVSSFKTTSVATQGNKLTVEGMIKFNSGKEKATSFIFEAKDATKNGKVRFIGENCQISRGKKSFTLTGSINNNKFIAEALNYNYRTKNESGKSQRVYGTVRLSESKKRK